MSAGAAEAIAIAYSGGRDSSALLLAACLAAQKIQQEIGQRPALVALHIHHGLSRNADAWLRHCRQTCRFLAAQGFDLRFAAQRLHLSAGGNIEARARRARYAALAAMAKKMRAGAVMLAHHREDQAETFLLQALRGAGLGGLSAMPALAKRDGIYWLRPFLKVPRARIEAFLQAAGMGWIEDESNGDERLARNRLRLSVMPALQRAFPGAAARLAQSADWAAHGNAALQQAAAAALAEMEQGKALVLSQWGALSLERRRLVLRAWFARQSGQAMPKSLTERLERELSAGAQPASGAMFAQPALWPAPGGVLRRYRGLLHWQAGDRLAKAQTGQGAMSPSMLSLRRCGRIPLPDWGGVLIVRRARPDEEGLPAQSVELSLRARSGGERFQLGQQRPARSLKKQFQSAAIAAHLRSGPLLWRGDDLIFVPGLGLDARCRVSNGARWVLVWQAAD